MMMAEARYKDHFRALSDVASLRRCSLVDCGTYGHCSNSNLAPTPEWTEYRKKNGLDPLGMQTGSVNIYQRLLPGISNVTLRMRYYGIYAWLADTYAKQVGDTNTKNWQRFVRRAEALYALIAQRQGNEIGVAGVDWARDALEAIAQTKNETIEFAVATEPVHP